MVLRGGRSFAPATPTLRTAQQVPDRPFRRDRRTVVCREGCGALSAARNRQPGFARGRRGWTLALAHQKRAGSAAGARRWGAYHKGSHQPAPLLGWGSGLRPGLVRANVRPRTLRSPVFLETMGTKKSEETEFWVDGCWGGWAHAL